MTLAMSAGFDLYEDSCSVDTTHPNDIGFMMMAEGIGRVLTHILRGVL